MSGLVYPDGRPIPSTRSQHIRRIMNSGYSNSAASLTKSVFKGWDWSGGSPDDDIVENLPIIRQRSRQLTMDAPIIAGLYRTLTTNCVGEGLTPEPSPDAAYLGMEPDDVLKWKASVLRCWDLFAESTGCDVYRRDNFYELTRLLCRAQDESGDVFVTMPVFHRKNVTFDLHLQVIEADCVCDPEGAEFVAYMEQGSDIFGGVELSPYGDVLAYWFHTGHPLQQRVRPVYSQRERRPEWTRIPAYGEETGRPNVLHLMDSQRPGQRRGIPLITPVIELALTLDRYIKAEAIAAEVQALFTVIITSETPEAMAGEMNSLVRDIRGNQNEDDGDINLAPGLVQYAKPGEKVEPVNPSRPTNAFETFVGAVQKMIGASTGVPYELLVQSFNASYSASRAAMNMASAQFKVKRAGLVNDFCKPVYEAFMDEAVARGLIHAPGYFTDPMKRLAYTQAVWHGPSMPQIDPLKEINAGIQRVVHGVSTLSELTSELTGGDWYANAAARGREIEISKQMGMAAPAGTTSGKGSDDDE